MRSRALVVGLVLGAWGCAAAQEGGGPPEAASPEAVLADLQEGTRLMQGREFAAALPRLEAAVGPIRAQFGGASPVLAQVLNGVGLCRLRVGRPQEALEAFGEAYACVESVEADGDGTPGAILRNMGELHWAARRYEEAARAFEGAWARWERTFGASHLLVASAQLGLGACRLKLGKQDEALEVLERCLGIVAATRALPAEGEAIENLTIVDEDPGLVEQSIAALARSLPLRRQAFGAAHPDVVRHAAVLAGLETLRTPKPDPAPPGE